MVETLEAAGYDPEVQEFDYLAYEVGPSALREIAPNAITYCFGQWSARGFGGAYSRLGRSNALVGHDAVVGANVG